VDGEAPQVGGDPAPTQLLGHGRRRAAAGEAVEDEVAFVGGGFDDAFKYFFGLLRWVSQVLSLVSGLKHGYPPNIVYSTCG